MTPPIYQVGCDPAAVGWWVAGCTLVAYGLGVAFTFAAFEARKRGWL